MRDGSTVGPKYFNVGCKFNTNYVRNYDQLEFGMISNHTQRKLNLL